MFLIDAILNLFRRKEEQSSSDRMGGPEVAKINKHLSQYVGQKASDVYIELLKQFPTYWIVNLETYHKENAFTRKDGYVTSISCDFQFDRIVIEPDENGIVYRVDVG